MTHAVVGHRAGADATGDLTAVARGGVANLVGAVCSAGTNFVLVLVVARFLSTDDAGRFFAATSLFLVLETVGRLGADTGLVYFIARWRALGRDSSIGAGLRAGMVPVLALCVALSVAMLVFAAPLARLIGDESAKSAGLLRVLAVALPIAALYDISLGATRGFAKMRPTVLVEKIGRPLAQLLLVAAVLVFGWDAGIGLAWALPYAGAALVAVLMLRSIMGGRARTAGDPSRQAVPRVLREFWSFTLPRAVAGVAQIVLQRLDIVLVGAIRGPRDAAIYTAATRFLVVGQFLNQAITAPVQPQMSSALSQHDVPRARTLYRVTTTWLVLVSWPLFGIAAAMAPTYISLFGRSYHDGIVVVLVLSVAMLVASACGLVDTVIIMGGKSSWNLWTTLLALLVNVSLNVVLIPHLGLFGAAVAWFAAIMAANVVPLLLSWRWLDLHPYGRSTLAAIGLCSLCYLLLPQLGRWLFGGQVAALVAIMIGTVIYLAGLWRGRELFALTAMVSRGRKAVA
jgi:O-antigen/teichoic acid export membrane protein